MAKQRTKKELIDTILDDQEKLALQMFIDNDIQREAVRKVLLFGVYQSGTLKKGKEANPLNNFMLAYVSNAAELHLKNEEIGEYARAAWEGIQLVENAFEAINAYRKLEEKTPDTSNPAI